jgi:curved DNA-binding protein CbpA
VPGENPYRVLGLTDAATRTQVTHAYRALARALHPDTNPDPAAAEKLARVIDAYHRLTLPPDPTDQPNRGRPQPGPPHPPPAQRRPRGPTIVAGPVHIRPLPPRDTGRR